MLFNNVSYHADIIDTLSEQKNNKKCVTVFFTSKLLTKQTGIHICIGIVNKKGRFRKIKIIIIKFYYLYEEHIQKAKREKERYQLINFFINKSITPNLT